jgi:hypothetical protein
LLQGHEQCRHNTWNFECAGLERPVITVFTRYITSLVCENVLYYVLKTQTVYTRCGYWYYLKTTNTFKCLKYVKSLPNMPVLCVTWTIFHMVLIHYMYIPYPFTVKIKYNIPPQGKWSMFGLESMNYRTWGEHANHYATDAVYQVWYNILCIAQFQVSWNRWNENYLQCYVKLKCTHIRNKILCNYNSTMIDFWFESFVEY